MSSIVLGNGTTAKATSTNANKSVPTSLSSTAAPPAKRKFSQEGNSSTMDNAKRIKCSHPSLLATSNTTTTSNGVGGSTTNNNNKIATNTIMITNNYSKNGLTPTSSSTRTTTTSNSSQITILARNNNDHDHSDVDNRRPMVVDQINICINNHFSSDAALMTTTTSATAKLPELIKIQKKGSNVNNKQNQQPKLGYEAVCVKDEEVESVMDVEEAVKGFTIKKEPVEEEEDLVHEDPVDTNQMTVVRVTDTNQTAKKAFAEKSFSQTKYEHQSVNPISIGEEVLVPRKSLEDDDDSCFYLGILTVVHRDQVLVQFEDGTNCWAGTTDIKRILRHPDTIYCVVCKTRELKSAVESGTTHDCTNCGRVYHKTCLLEELRKLAAMPMVVEKFNENIYCLRCFKREAGIDQEDETTVTPLPDTVSAGDTKSHPGLIKSNSSNTGNSTTTTASSVINHHHNQVEIGAPSMDWFTKERRKCDPLTNNNNISNNNSIPTPGSDSLDVHPEDLEEDEIKQEDDQFFQDSTTGRRLRKRSQKRNYKDLQRTSISNSSTAIIASNNNINSTSTSSTSWSCASSSSSSSSAAVAPVNNSCSNNNSSSAPWSVVSPFGTSSNVFTLDELRWAFLPKFKRRGGVKKEKGSTSNERERKSNNNSLSNTVKVPYEKLSSREGSSSSSSSSRANSRRASRDVQHEMREEVKMLLNGPRSEGGVVMEAKSRLARGDKYSVRGKRQDSLGNVQYLIEWENKGT